jgi:polysaccharide biosynthesis protein PelF
VALSIAFARKGNGMTAAAAKVQPAFDWSRRSSATADVCLIVEGCYPFVPGGVSGWIDWLIRTQPHLTFSVVSLWPEPNGAHARYAMPDNAIAFHPLYLQDFGAAPQLTGKPPRGLDRLAEALTRFMRHGGDANLVQLIEARRALVPQMALSQILNGPIGWDLVGRMYRDAMPSGSFLHYFWAWRALLGGLFATLEFPMPQAKIYHTISTGYAGVFAARAIRETGKPMFLTEHGIYTNERRIELLMADWVADTLDKGHAIDDTRMDLRDMWIQAFESYARTCYETASEVITLYEDNQRVQKLLGAPHDHCRVIANGIGLDRFAGLAQANDDAQPTVALIGRVVPIKDVKCYINAMKILRESVPNLRAYVLGPLDEDPGYVVECRQLVADLDMGDSIIFTGAVNITEYLPHVHVVALTSLSESQPLTLLEAGAAGIPFVSTNVGSCREIIEGRSDENPPLGRGGFVTPVVAPTEIAEAIQRLLQDHGLRRQFGATLRERVRAFYRSEQAAGAYQTLYHGYLERR